MHKLKPSLALAAAGVIGIALWAGAKVDTTGNQMAESANRFLAALDDSQKSQATFKFDDAERLNWHFIPRPRKGLPIKEMTPAQRALAFGLVQAGLGGHLLTCAIERGFATPAGRVWLHTCTLDHPQALANYQARGLRLLKEETTSMEVSEQPSGPWPGA